MIILNNYKGALTRKAVKMMVTWFNDFRIKRCVPIALVFAAAFIFIGGNRQTQASYEILYSEISCEFANYLGTVV